MSCGCSGVVPRRTPLQPQSFYFRNCCKTNGLSNISLANSRKRYKNQCFFITFALLGLLSWDCSPGMALLGLLSWDCSPRIAFPGLLCWNCSLGIALLGLLSLVALLDCSELSGAIWSYLKLSGAIWSFLELSGAIWSYLELSGAI